MNASGEARSRPRAGARRVVTRLAVLCLSTSVWVGAAELLLRRFAPVDEVVFELDPRRLYRPLPGARTLEMPPPGSRASPVDWRFDSRGLRGEELGPKRAGVQRVLVLGDSFIHARETPLAETFTARLQDELQRAGRPVESLNAGVAGYGPDQTLLRFEEEVDALAVDVVVFAVCAHNDLDDPFRNGIFALSESGELVEREPGIDPRYAERYERKRALAARPMLVRWLSHLLMEQPEHAGPTHAQREAWRVASRAYAEFLGEAPADTSSEALDALAVARAKIALFERLLARLQAGCLARDIDFAVVVIPSSYDIVDPDPPSVSNARTGGATNRAIASVARKLGVPCLDLYPPFWERADEPLYLGAGEIHWSARGQAFAAALVAEFLTSSATQ